MDDYTIIQDTREKLAWDFSQFGKKQVISKLDAGDYSLLGHENKISIERKASTGELYANLLKKYHSFSKELEKLSHLEEKYLVCEFPLTYILSFPANSGIVKSNWKFLKGNSKIFLSKLETLNNYDITIIFSESKLDAQLKVLNIFNEYIKRIT